MSSSEERSPSTCSMPSLPLTFATETSLIPFCIAAVPLPMVPFSAWPFLSLAQSRRQATLAIRLLEENAYWFVSLEIVVGTHWLFQFVEYQNFWDFPYNYWNNFCFFHLIHLFPLGGMSVGMNSKGCPFVSISFNPSASPLATGDPVFYSQTLTLAPPHQNPQYYDRQRFDFCPNLAISVPIHQEMDVETKKGAFGGKITYTNKRMETTDWMDCWKRTPLTTVPFEIAFLVSSSFLECIRYRSKSLWRQYRPE